jgi:hypothetical protein
LSMLKKPGNQNRAQNSFFQKINQKKSSLFPVPVVVQQQFQWLRWHFFSFFILNQKYFSG